MNKSYVELMNDRELRFFGLQIVSDSLKWNYVDAPLISLNEQKSLKLGKVKDKYHLKQDLKCII